MRTLVALIMLVSPASPAPSAELKVGAAAVVITPPAGTPMAGYYLERGARSVHDDLYARSIVIESGDRAAALVVLDLITTPRELVERARGEIERTTRIRGADVMISATHSHTGPVVDRNSPFGGQSDAVRDYLAGLPARIAESVRQAEGRLAPARASAATGRETSIAFNRRYHMRDGSVGWNPGKLNPAIIKPAGTIDPEVPVVYFESAAGRPIATYVNHAVHLDNVGEPSISADLVYPLSRALADFKGPEMVTVFSAGCCGDVNHIDVNWREPQGGSANAARMGTILAAEVLRAWPRLEAVAADAVRVRSAMVRLTLPAISEADVARSRSVIERMQDPKGHRPGFLEMVDAFKTRDVAARQGRPLEVEVQVVALGDDLAWVSLPGEVFVELGLAIKQDSPFRRTIIAELADGSIGYIPSRRAYAQGNYEVVSARCAEGSGERLVDAAGRLLRELYAEAHPARSGAPECRPRGTVADRSGDERDIGVGLPGGEPIEGFLAGADDGRVVSQPDDVGAEADELVHVADQGDPAGLAYLEYEADQGAEGGARERADRMEVEDEPVGELGPDQRGELPAQIRGVIRVGDGVAEELHERCAWVIDTLVGDQGAGLAGHGHPPFRGARGERPRVATGCGPGSFERDGLGRGWTLRSAGRDAVDPQLARVGLREPEDRAAVLGEADETLHEGHALAEPVVLVDLHRGLDQGAGQEDDGLGARPGDRDVQSVQAVDELLLAEGRFDVGHAVADDDGLALLALHPVDGLDERRAVPGAGTVERAADRRDLDVVRADDEQAVLPEGGIPLGRVGVRLSRSGLHALAEPDDGPRHQGGLEAVLGRCPQAVEDADHQRVIGIDQGVGQIVAR